MNVAELIIELRKMPHSATVVVTGPYDGRPEVADHCTKITRHSDSRMFEDVYVKTASIVYIGGSS